MIKVKQYDLQKNINSEVDEWQNDIKNPIKSFYFQKKKDDELINKYEKSFQTFKNEYTIVYKRNEDLEKENKELKNQIKQMQTQENQFHQNQFYQNQFERKRPLSRFDYENNDDENIQYIIKKKRKNPPRVIYEEEESEKEEEKEMNVDQKKDYDIDVKKLTKKNKGISKSIKM